jgi:hypothetical protein
MRHDGRGESFSNPRLAGSRSPARQQVFAQLFPGRMELLCPNMNLQCAVRGDPELVRNERSQDPLADARFHFVVSSLFIKKARKTTQS